MTMKGFIQFLRGLKYMTYALTVVPKSLDGVTIRSVLEDIWNSNTSKRQTLLQLSVRVFSSRLERFHWDLDSRVKLYMWMIKPEFEKNFINDVLSQKYRSLRKMNRLWLCVWLVLASDYAFSGNKRQLLDSKSSYFQKSFKFSGLNLSFFLPEIQKDWVSLLESYKISYVFCKTSMNRRPWVDGVPADAVVARFRNLIKKGTVSSLGHGKPHDGAYIQFGDNRRTSCYRYKQISFECRVYIAARVHLIFLFAC